MMRDRYKFRAFNIHSKKMEYDVQDEYDYMINYGGACAYNFGSLLEDKDYIIMQSPGIKDKNGKLIYEGDILESTNGFNKKIGVVKYDDNFLQFRASNMSLFSMVNRSVAIGNIYENPELLKSIQLDHKKQFDEMSSEELDEYLERLI